MTRIKNIFLILLLGTISVACSKDDDSSGSIPEDSNIEYFNCKINGVQFEARTGADCTGELFGYYPEEGDGTPAGYMVLSGIDCLGERDLVAIRLFGFHPELGLLDFVEPHLADSISPIYMVNTDLKYERLVSGSMNLTHFRSRELPNGRLGLVQGTFEFTVSDESGDSLIHVTEGEFRYRVQNTW